LTLRLDDVVFYDAELWPNPIICWVTAPVPAVVSWNGVTIVFDNSAQARLSAYSSFFIRDPAWLYSQHVFTVPLGLGCGALRQNLGTRFRPRWVETGFQCGGTVGASTIAVVMVQ
jgi:hypothetical protein